MKKKGKVKKVIAVGALAAVVYQARKRGADQKVKKHAGRAADWAKDKLKGNN